MKIKLIISIFLLVNILSGSFAQNKRLSKEEVDMEEAFVNAKNLVLRGKTDDAKKAFADLLKKDKTNPNIAYELARIEFLEGSDELALRHAQIAASDKSNSWFQLLLADILQKMGNLKAAAGVYEQLTITNPIEKDYYYNMAECYEKMEDFPNALLAYDKCEKNNNADITTIKKKQLIYLKTGKPDLAIVELKKLVDLHPSNTEYKHFLATLYEKVGKEDLAQNVYKEILAINPSDAKASLAIINKNADKNNPGSYLATLKPLFQKKEVSLDLKIKELIPIAQTVADKNDQELANKALELTSILHEVHPNDPKVFAIEGDLLYYSGKSADALKSYHKVIELNKSILPVWSQLLQIYSEQKKYAELYQYAENALDYFPNQAIIHYYDGLANIGLNKLADATNSLKTAINLTNKNLYLQGDVLVSLINAYHLQKKYLESKELVTKYLPKENDYEAKVLESFGDSYFYNGDSTNALKYWNKSKEKGNKSEELSKKIADKKI
ncbi:MAG: tetratricopeptide repeat protein [Saprospiraceae bacterium]|nr:tetratricopeptide repeat protein [Saprospiraceae bacterium]